MSDKPTKINVRDWITLSTVMIGAVLTILALIWQFPPFNGIVTATFFLMLSFVFFVNSVSANSKANFEVNSGNVSQSRINRFVTFAEYSFGFGFTLVIIGFTILGYEYLLDYNGREVITLMLPIAFLGTAWVVIFIYNIINYSGKSLKALRSIKRNLWILLELISLVLICFDFFEIILIP
ncbi:MAG: hypothetical protein ACXAEX_11130 [Promethearchaeota archaeon]|jgi:hypothetical protein